MNGGGRFWINQAKNSQSEQNGSVELYRSYGVKRRLRPWQEKVVLNFGRIVLIWMLSVLLLAAGLALVAFFVSFPELWIKVLIGVAVALFLGIRMTRTLRKRRKFCGRLKRLCKKRRYRLTPIRKFLSSLFWAGNREDLVLETGECVYYIRFLTVRKYRSTLYFEKPDSLKLVTRPLNNKFTLIFDVQPRVKYYPLDFTVEERVRSLWKDKKQIKALIINPVCAEMLYKKRDGGYESTGNGGEHYGYTVFTGSGFLEFVQRNETREQARY